MKLLRQIFIFPILIYQVTISPYLASGCRFQPSCSVYAKEAIMKYGVVKGFLLIGSRLLSCHPYGKSGYDPVPIKNEIVNK